jgi:hypothetical protein
LQLDAIHDERDGVLLFFVERRDLVELMRLAVDHDAHEAAFLQLDEELFVFAFAVHHQRRHERERRARRQPEHFVGDFFRRLRFDRLAALMTVLNAHLGVEHAQVVGDLGDRSHRRSGIARGALLLDGDGRRKPAQVIDVRSLELSQKLPRVRAERLDVTALPLGVEGVESEARFARPADAGEDDELALRNFEAIDVEVVFARS